MKKDLLSKVIVCLAMLAVVIPAKAQREYSLQTDLLKIPADGRTLSIRRERTVVCMPCCKIR